LLEAEADRGRDRAVDDGDAARRAAEQDREIRGAVDRRLEPVDVVMMAGRPVIRPALRRRS
jgi:hypothetical protein